LLIHRCYARIRRSKYLQIPSNCVCLVEINIRSSHSNMRHNLKFSKYGRDLEN